MYVDLLLRSIKCRSNTNFFGSFYVIIVLKVIFCEFLKRLYHWNDAFFLLTGPRIQIIMNFDLEIIDINGNELSL